MNKALWFSDVTAYRVDGEPITNEKYVKRQFGPVPRRVLHALERLQMEGAIAIMEPEHEFDTRKYVSLKPPSSTLLNDREKYITSVVLESVLGHTANEISEMSHDHIWEAAFEGEEIPLAATLGSPGEITSESLVWAAKVVENAAST